MKGVLCILAILAATHARAQLANGSTAPDFTFTDISGITQHLYSYLDQGKYVAIDISTTWCAPCWAYHNTRTMDSLYLLHDDPGDHTFKVLFIEGDGGTDLADVQGTGTSTQGNWTTGTLFPICNPPSGPGLNDFNTGYVISAWPTFYIICPNKKVFQDTLNFGGVKPTVRTWEYAAGRCGAAGLDDPRDADPLTIFPNPATDHATLYFALNNPQHITVSVTDILGRSVSYNDLGPLNPGDQAISYDIANWQPGLYFFCISDEKGRHIFKRLCVK